MYQIAVFNHSKKYLTIFMLALLFILIFPIGIVVADEIGGYISEKLIGSSATLNSNLTVGRDGTDNSFLDIGLAGVDDLPNPYLNPGSSQYQLNTLFPLVLTGMIIVLLVAFMAKGEFSIAGLVIIVVLLYMFYSFLAGININIVNLLGGSK